MKRLRNHIVTQKEEEVPRGRQGGGRSFSRGRGRRGGGELRCYVCGKTGHMSWECPEKKKKEEVKLTFQRHREEMLKKKEQRMEYP
jgi:hypothetical protein